jgi:hypothetical protein
VDNILTGQIKGREYPIPTVGTKDVCKGLPRCFRHGCLRAFNIVVNFWLVCDARNLKEEFSNECDR